MNLRRDVLVPSFPKDAGQPLGSRDGCLSLARALLNERLSLFEGGREVPLHQKGFGEGFSFPAAQDTHFAGGPVENNFHDRSFIPGWPIRFPGVQSLRAGEGIATPSPSRRALPTIRWPRPQLLPGD
jgi:hypothetical protein